MAMPGSTNGTPRSRTRQLRSRARIVLGMGTSHTPMLNAPPTDWPRFFERDSNRTNLLDIEGRLTSYDEQLKHAPPGIAAEITPDRMAARHETVQGAMARLGGFL